MAFVTSKTAISRNAPVKTPASFVGPFNRDGAKSTRTGDHTLGCVRSFLVGFTMINISILRHSWQTNECICSCTVAKRATRHGSYRGFLLRHHRAMSLID